MDSWRKLRKRVNAGRAIHNTGTALTVLGEFLLPLRCAALALMQIPGLSFSNCSLVHSSDHIPAFNNISLFCYH